MCDFIPPNCESKLVWINVLEQYPKKILLMTREFLLEDIKLISIVEDKAPHILVFLEPEIQDKYYKKKKYDKIQQEKCYTIQQKKTQYSTTETPITENKKRKENRNAIIKINNINIFIIFYHVLFYHIFLSAF